ncbi:uncharacterized protein TNCV_1466821 [Trichonephila clavipes]|nr:uncharacterized protein TNCV_1466821 [Trichonephila clavipes]
MLLSSDAYSQSGVGLAQSASLVGRGKKRVGVCNNRIVLAQRKHLDDFLRGRIIGRMQCGRTQLEVSEGNLESPRVSHPGFDNDS